jgi:hypothetical protein
MNITRTLLGSSGALVFGLVALWACDGVKAGDQTLGPVQPGSSVGGRCYWTAGTGAESAGLPVSTSAGYAQGEAFTGPDGCNACRCLEDGLSCTARASCAAVEYCVADGRARGVGDTWVSATVTAAGEAGTLLTASGRTRCGVASFPAGSSCSCLPGGKVSCEVAAGKAASCACEYGGKERESGTSFAATDGCNTCGCDTRGITCTTNKCGDAGMDAAAKPDASSDAATSDAMVSDAQPDAAVDAAPTQDDAASDATTQDDAASDATSDAGSDASDAQ